MNTHDTIELPPLPIHFDDYMDRGTKAEVQAHVRNAIEADRKRRGEPVARVNNDGFIVETGLSLAPGTLLFSAPTPPAGEQAQPPRLYQHDDGRYGLSFGPARFAVGDPAWHRVPIDITENSEEA